MKKLLSILLIPSILSANPLKNAFKPSQAVRFSSTLNKNLILPGLPNRQNNQIYKCDKCLTAFGCPTFRKGMDIAKQQPRGKVQKDDIFQALASGTASLLNAAPAAFILSNSYSALETPELMGIALFASLSATFGWRAISCLKHANDAWRTANELRQAISNRRLNGMNVILGAFNAGAYGSKALDSKEDRGIRIASAMIAASQAAMAAHSFNEIPKVKNEQIETCCEAQKKFEQMKKELKK